MTANKMPEMPEAKFWWKPPTDTPLFYYNDSRVMVEAGFTKLYVDADVQAYGCMCDYMGYQRGYLAGLEAARGCVPEMKNPDAQTTLSGQYHAQGHNACRSRTLANLSALEQGVGK